MARDSTKRNDQAFSRMFNWEFLQVRKDITPVMLACAKGDYKAVEKAVKAEPHLVWTSNKDGNTLLLLAVANQQLELTHLLLDMKSSLTHRNKCQMDVIDYATLEGVKNKISKTVLSFCDFVIPENVAIGQKARDLEQTVLEAKDKGFVCVRGSILGVLPDFSDIFSQGTEYRHEWSQAMNWVCQTVKMGILLLSDDIDYLVHDSMLSGTLEVSTERRWVWLRKIQKPIRFKLALQKLYSTIMARRMLEACNDADATAVQGLLKAHAHPNIEDLYGQTALMKAAHSGNPAVVRSLLIAKAKVNIVSKDGYNPLMLAAVAGNDKVTAMLLKAKADATSKSNKGNTVLDLVKHTGNPRMLGIVQDHLLALQNKKPSQNNAPGQTNYV